MYIPNNFQTPTKAYN